MHTAFRVTQGQVAAAARSGPKRLRRPHAFPGWPWPPWQNGALAWTTMETTHVEPRQGRRKRDKNLCYFLLYLPICGVRRGSGKDSTQLVSRPLAKDTMRMHVSRGSLPCRNGDVDRTGCITGIFPCTTGNILTSNFATRDDRASVPPPWRLPGARTPF